METEEKTDNTRSEQQGLVDEARRKENNTSKEAPGGKRPQRSHPQGSAIVQSKAAEHYSHGEDATGRFQYEKAVICFSKAATLQPHQTRLFAAQAEAYLQLCDFQSAAACYQKACLLEPGAFSGRLAFIYYLQGQCLFDRGLFPEALEAVSRAAGVAPGCRAHAVRSLVCLAAAGRHADCLKLVNDWMASDGATSDLLVLRARLHRRLHQTSRCHQDVRSALALNPTCPEAGALLLQLRRAAERARQRAVGRAVSGRLSEAVCEIDVALENCPHDARLYLFRGILYRRLKDFTAAIEDLVQAVELSEGAGEEQQEVRGQAEARDGEDDEQRSLEEEAEFQLVLTYNDFAVQCFGRGLFAEAALLLNKAVDEEKGQAGLYLNRGDCFFKQGEWSYALADYQQAEEMMRPDDPAVRRRLAVLHNTLGSLHFQDGRFQEAADMFSVAVRYDPSAGRYYENRARSLRRVGNPVGARRDLIRTLVLDPTSQELPPMLTDLFPGRSASDVLSSPAGQEVRGQLTASVSEQQRLSEKVTPLTNEAAASRSRDPAAAGEEPRSCVDQQEAGLTVRSLLQALMGKPSERF
ncbi:tetratricopeptide repeat protein 16 isoform X2 [Scophthalmus maximus]|uniref:tetratricopeptide repeat protein 16 isoform X2 n=1 Tax=Scophthalmus maximus TaxID=52904 RepID=UPI001FA91327|nr:tetratricopeptide repeat protein 16 isoform X2 [Scophthalmus maximus]